MRTNELDYKTLQRLFTDINDEAKKAETHEQASDDQRILTSLFDNQNLQYSYFSSTDEAVKEEYRRYFRFLKKISENEDSNISTNELSHRAYIALVLFGGREEGKECQTLQRYINENFKHATHPIHDAFSTISIQPKSQYLDLIYWRKLINSDKTKTAIQLFSEAADIANKFGPAAPTSKSYELILTKTTPNNKNTIPGKLYFFKGRDDSKFAFAYKNDQGDLEFRSVDKMTINTINESLFNKLNDIFSNEAWRSGEWPDHKITTEMQDIIFSELNKVPDKAILLRTLTLDEVSSLRGKLYYSRFDENPDFSLICRHYRMPESLFNRCLDLIPDRKKKDNLPDITIDGSTLSNTLKDCSHYVLTKLPIDDPRAFILGTITNCCQSIGGNSEACVIDGWRRENNGFYVLLERKKNSPPNSPVKNSAGIINDKNFDIVGQAYAWKSINGNLVFDSWENLRPLSDDTIAVAMLTAFAEQAVTVPEHGIFQVTIGRGGRTPRELLIPTNSVPVAEIMLEGNQYGDSKSQVKIFALTNNLELTKEWQLELDVAIEKIPGLLDAQKKELKMHMPLSSNIITVLTLAQNEKSPFNHLIKSALTISEKKFLPDMLSAMIMLNTVYPAEIASETLATLEKSEFYNLSTMLTAEEISQQPIAMPPQDETDTDDEESNDENSEEQDSDNESSESDEENTENAAENIGDWNDEPEQIVASLSKDYIGVSKKIADFLITLNANKIFDTKIRRLALEQFIMGIKILFSLNRDSSFFYEKIHSSLSYEKIQSKIISSIRSNELEKMDIAELIDYDFDLCYELLSLSNDILSHSIKIKILDSCLLNNTTIALPIIIRLFSLSLDQLSSELRAIIIEKKMSEVVSNANDIVTLFRLPIEQLSSDLRTMIIESNIKILCGIDAIIKLFSLPPNRISKEQYATIFSAMEYPFETIVKSCSFFELDQLLSGLSSDKIEHDRFAQLLSIAKDNIVSRMHKMDNPFELSIFSNNQLSKDQLRELIPAENENFFPDVHLLFWPRTYTSRRSEQFLDILIENYNKNPTMTKLDIDYIAEIFSLSSDILSLEQRDRIFSALRNHIDDLAKQIPDEQIARILLLPKYKLSENTRSEFLAAFLKKENISKNKILGHDFHCFLETYIFESPKNPFSINDRMTILNTVLNDLPSFEKRQKFSVMEIVYCLMVGEDQLLPQHRALIKEGIINNITRFISSGDDLVNLFAYLDNKQLSMVDRTKILNMLSNNFGVLFEDTESIIRFFSLSIEKFSEEQRILVWNVLQNHPNLPEHRPDRIPTPTSSRTSSPAAFFRDLHQKKETVLSRVNKNEKTPKS